MVSLVWIKQATWQMSVHSRLSCTWIGGDGGITSTDIFLDEWGEISSSSMLFNFLRRCKPVIRIEDITDRFIHYMRAWVISWCCERRTLHESPTTMTLSNLSHLWSLRIIKSWQVLVADPQTGSGNSGRSESQRISYDSWYNLSFFITNFISGSCDPGRRE